MDANNGRKYPCARCPQSFKTARDLSTHVRRHDGDKLYRCDDCSKAFCTAYELDCHERSHTGDRPFCCAKCPASFATQASLANHRPTHLLDGEKGRFACRHCPATFVRTATRTAHERTHRSDCPHQCAVCGKNFPQKSNLTRHLKLHVEGRQLQCSVCSGSFGSAEILANHRKTCADFLHKCSECGMGFVEEADIKAHALSAHRLNSAGRVNFDDSASSSGDERPDFDTSSDEGAARSKNVAGKLTVRLKPSRGKSCRPAASGSRAVGDLQPDPEDRDVARSKVSQLSEDSLPDDAGYLSRGAAAGVGAAVFAAAVKPTYKCTECSHWCNEWKALKEHAAVEHRSDLAGYQFRCHVCPKAFAQNSNLKTHLKSHNRVAAFACDLCGRQFALKHHMQRHRARH